MVGFHNSYHIMTVTSSLRKESDQVFVATCSTLNTIAWCLKEVLKLLDVDVSMYTTQSTRSASASISAVVDSGVTTSDILIKVADWSTESVCRRFYYHPTYDPFYGQAVLSS